MEKYGRILTMNKKTLKGLIFEEEIMNEIKDTHFEIRDLEKELEWTHSREPDDYKYIAYLTNRIDKLYKKIDELNENN
jgi:hypothetical protein